MKYHRNTKVKPRRIYALVVIIFALLSILYLVWRKAPIISPNVSSNFMYDGFSNNGFKNKEMVAFTGDRIVHLDLKGAPPKVEYYRKLFPLLSTLGATGLLIEYEDMFPYTGSLLGNVSAANAYSLRDIQLINQLAKESHLKIIPLVPTFGHMEFILKLADFQDYREVATYPQVLCPTHPNAMHLLEDMLDQVIRSHPDSELIHIGADEVYYLGICERCSNAMFNYNLSKNLLFLEHINAVTAFIKKKYPHLRVLMWDDEFRSTQQNDLTKHKLNENVEPVVWKYNKDVYEELGPSLWNLYTQTFKKIWVASAFKGATGSNQFVTDVMHYLQNHRSWLSVIAEYKNRINFEGIIITGWQRYDHFAVLCELLPVGIPSLAMSLSLILGHDDSPLRPPTAIAKILKCELPYALMGPVFGSPKCAYPGGKILECVLHLQLLKQEYEQILGDSRTKGWLNPYNIKYSFSSPHYVEAVTAPLGGIRAELEQVEVEMKSAMEEVYDIYTIDEWIETYIKPFRKEVDDLWEARKNILYKESWPKRPLNQIVAKNKNEF